MPRYYFDIYDDQFTITDDQGEELAGLEPAKKHAIEVAASVGKDIFPKGHSKVTVIVRDDERPVFEATVFVQTSVAA